MNENNMTALFEKINDPELTSLPDIAQLSYSAFLRRVGSTLNLTDCHYLYQHAVHTAAQNVRRTAFTQGNPQLHHAAHLMGTVAVLSEEADMPAFPSQPVLGEQP